MAGGRDVGVNRVAQDQEESAMIGEEEPESVLSLL
jgi:hypothetical protein